jgi:hypothetical protein
MVCLLCGSRKARRGCPALNQMICPVCCGTKRLTEIACPAECTWLASAREHPAAVVRRQQERDTALILPTLRELTQRQNQLFFVFHTAVSRHVPDGFARLTDDDVAEAAGVVASTLETAARGVIYEPAAQSLTAQRLAADLKKVVADLRQQGIAVSDRDASVALRAIETGAREARLMPGGGPAETAYIDMIGRLLQQNRAAATEEAPTRPASSLIIPG